LRYREQTHKHYSLLFGDTQKEDELYGADREELEVKNSLASKYGWFLVIYNMAGENILNVDKIVKRPINECLNWLALSSEIEKERERIEKYKGN
tara:strand:- start:217 stop:498 length:282 start_codon:yes stop_codon:yes gene_type:complete